MDTVKIIFADDDVVARKLVLKLMREADFKVIIAENGREAWDLLKRTGARVVVTDWSMPEMNGLDLCRKIRSEILDTYVFIILITSRSDKEDTIEGLRAGADDFLVKPLNVGELTARIRSGIRIIELEDRVKKAGEQLYQSEKMASVGQLAAGVAHEINNPTGFVSSNLKTLAGYQKDVNALLTRYRELKQTIRGDANERSPSISEALELIDRKEEELDIDYLMKDSEDLIGESLEGMERIKKIVMDLKDFAHPGEDTMKEADINACLDSTLNVIWNEIKYSAQVKKHYGNLPLVPCFPQQLNQVFMNMIINASQAIEGEGVITLTTDHDASGITVRIKDTGKGIPKENLSRIFDPFFTTKEVGKGTGLGMNVAYNIVKKHRGTIDVVSEVGKGTEFTVHLPLDQPSA
ncbi:ATP-binding protein [Desulfatiferula olefinivorans]